MGPINQNALAAFLTEAATATTCFCVGSAVLSGVALWGGKKVLELQFDKEGAERTDLTANEKTAYKCLGHAIIAFGVISGVAAALTFSFAIAPISTATVLALIGTSSAVTNTAFYLSMLAGAAFSTYCLSRGVSYAYSPETPLAEA